MSISSALLPEFDHEMANTRKTLERVPEDKFGWKPHEKSMSMGDLATHLATLPGWTMITLHQDEFDTNPPDGDPFKQPTLKTTAELLAEFDKNVAAARDALAAATDEKLFQGWTLKDGGKTVLTMPRVACLRGFIMNHNVHHRAQLGVYLRLNDVAVPSIYGPSADEAM